MLRKLLNMFLVFDNDEKGQKAQKRIARGGTLRGIDVVIVTPSDLGGSKDVSEALSTGCLDVNALKSAAQNDVVKEGEQDIQNPIEPPSSLTVPATPAGNDSAYTESKIVPEIQEEDSSFLTSYTDEDAARIKASTWLVLDTETTALTRQSQPVKVTASTKIGDKTYKQYRNEYPECSIDMTPRPRIASLQIEGCRKAYDLDKLSPEEQVRLLTDCINGKILIGHNLGFDLNWCGTLTDAKPARIIDTMVFTRICRPDIPIKLHGSAVNNEEAATLVTQNQSFGSVSLASVSAACGFPAPDKTYQKPANWAVSDLSPAHLDYVQGDVDLPLRILQCLLDTSYGNIEECMDVLDNHYPIYREFYEPFLKALVKIHQTGMPLDLEYLKLLMEQQRSIVAGAVDELIQTYQGFASCRETLENLSGGLTDKVKEAWKACFLENGIEPLETKTGQVKLSQKDIKASGALENPLLKAAWQCWEQLQALKKLHKMLQGYLGISVPDPEHPGYHRLRPIISVNTTTGRTSSQEPNSQNLPRDQDVRRIIKAPSGKVMVSIDYSQIELRNGAAYGVKAVREIRNFLQNPADKKLASMLTTDNQPNILSDEEIQSLPENKRGLAYWKRDREILTQTWQITKPFGESLPLAETFRRGLDPHLMTAVDMAARQGKLILGNKTPLEYLSGLGAEETKQLKELLASERQAAKAMNFGLLYGMSAGGLWMYGKASYELDWSKEEAVVARESWFKLYPEIKLWHLWTKVTGGKDKRKLLVRQESRKLEARDYKIWRGETLAGRSVLAIRHIDILNYQSQGSGADMLAYAVGSLPPKILQYVTNLIHDEILLEIPAEHAEQIEAEVKRCMIEAGEKLLQPYGIPVEVEASLDDVWKH